MLGLVPSRQINCCADAYDEFVCYPPIQRSPDDQADEKEKIMVIKRRRAKGPAGNRADGRTGGESYRSRSPNPFIVNFASGLRLKMSAFEQLVTYILTRGA